MSSAADHRPVSRRPPQSRKLDRLTTTQRAIRNHVNIDLPWSEQQQ
jgi:hypothetical protein